ncbi:fimbrial protein [Xenorhabdus sp. KJ12.1]|uniref:fimbrial protein n=1 Tax=Xenorhabdus sp. KJ12.1 TaxID=1851571 RepID=UPI000C0510C6|nr:fimbrial protein [Xenorhabdus sp. KJ12.1]PHM69765.1 fimbrial adhesin [Xenorhabdus sp. KJ12.1]
MVKGLKLLLASIFIIGMMSSFASQADYGGYSCHFMQGFTGDETKISFGGNIIVSKDHPIGTTIKEVFLDQLNRKGYIAHCNFRVPTSWDPPDFPKAHYNYDAIYESGVPGIGIRINNWGPTGYGIDWFPRWSDNPFTCSPPQRASQPYYYCGETWGYLTVQLIKIAPTTGSGKIEGRILTRARMGHSNIIHTFYLEQTNIITPIPSCSLTHKTTLVNMGEVKTSEFRGMHSATRTKDFNLELDCDANAKATMRLDGRPAKNGYSNIWALDQDSDNVTARGVGLQIIFLNRFLSQGESIVLQPSDQVRHFSLPMQARYIQTEARVTPGKANATATITLTYQ